MKAKKGLKNLAPGQSVALANDSTPGVVLRRTEPSIYLVSWKGHEITIHRNRLGVLVHGQFKFGRHNSTD